MTSDSWFEFSRVLWRVTLDEVGGWELVFYSSESLAEDSEIQNLKLNYI